jgi:hypothetical protein
MSTATATKRLTAQQARQLHDADVEVAKLKAALDIAESTVKELRARYKPRLVPSEDPKDAGKGVLVASAGGITIRVSPSISGDFFKLRDYKLAGHKVTPEMAEHISPGRPYDRWTTKLLEGPKRHDVRLIAYLRVSTEEQAEPATGSTPRSSSCAAPSSSAAGSSSS